MKKNNTQINVRLSDELNNLVNNYLLDFPDLTKSNLVRTALKNFVENQNELLTIQQKYEKQIELMKQSNSIVDNFKGLKSLELPKELVSKDENSIVIERVSSILSLNDENQAYKFACGLRKLLNECADTNKTVIFTETDSKGRISTKLFRNVYGIAISGILIEALDRGVKIYTLTDYKKRLYLEDIFEVLSEGISTSIHERTKVYDNLFFEKYNKSHFNQWLQWSFGLSRRDPIEEYNRLLRKNPNIVVDIDDIVERSQQAITNLQKRYKLFGMSDEGLQLAIEKIEKFIDLLSKYSGHYEPSNNCKNASIHELLKANNQKCPLKCGLKIN